MAQTIKLKRSATQGAIPTVAQLDLGEVAINTFDGKVYIKKDVNGTLSVVEVGANASVTPTGDDGSIQFNNNGVIGGAGFLYVDDTNNRLGIGTTTPATALDVNGTITVDGIVAQADASINGLTVGLGGGSVSTNTAVGSSALLSNTTGAGNTAFGVDALRSNTSGSYNSASGRFALYSNTSGYYNSASGANALYSNTSGNFNTASGFDALYGNTTGSFNTASGAYALRSNSTGSNNTASGANTLRFNTTGSSNTASGRDALYSNTAGIDNTASGYGALRSNTTGSSNTASGRDALRSNIDGSYNSASGRDALRFNTTGSSNIASGFNALYSNSTGSYNTASGRDALFSNSTGSYNTASGRNALNLNTSGSYNSGFGINAGSQITTGSKNTILGGYNGNQGGLDIRTANNFIVLSDGDGNPRQVIDSSGNVGIGTTTPSYNLEVSGIIGTTSIQLDTATTTDPLAQGQIAWNSDTGTAELGLNSAVALEMGEQTYINVKAAEAISTGDVLYASGALGNSGKIEVSKFIANGTIEERRVVGIAAQSIALGDFGYVITFGALRGLITDGSNLTTPEVWVTGDILYASPNVAGELTKVPPIAPNQKISIAFITSAHATVGSIVVRASDLGYHLGELHDIEFTSLTNNDIIAWNTANSRWQNVTIPSIVDSHYVNVTGDTMTGNLNFDDNVKATFGAGSDLQIYHDGNHSWIKDAGAGNIYISSDGYAVNFVKGDNAATVAQFIPDGPVNLYNAGDLKLSTTATGIDVTGAITADGLTSAGTILATSSTTINMILRGGDGNSKNLVFQKTTGSVQQAKISAVGDDLRFTTGPTDERMRITSSGDVGIGTTSPVTSLSFGEASTGITFLSTATNFNSGKVAGIRGEVGGTGYGNLAFDTFQGGNGGGERMMIRYDGNVGIGTSSPATKLHLQTDDVGVGSGEVAIRMSVPAATISAQNEIRSGVTSGTNPYMSFAVRETGIPYATVERMRIDSSGNLLVGTTDNSPVGNNVAGGIGLFSNGSGQFSRDGGTALLLNRKTSDGEILRFNKDGAVVGSIGTVNGDLLVGTGDTGLRFHDGDNRIYPINTSGGVKVDATIDLGDPTGRFKDLYLSGGLRGDTLTFSNLAGTERMRIDSSGYVGIGTSAPSQTFTVENNSGIFRINTSTSTYPRIEVGSASGTTAAIINRTTATQNIIFGETSDTGNYLFRGGNVGIGTTAPSEKLHVSGGNALIQGGTGTTSVSELGFTNAFDTAFLRSSYTNPSATTETYLAFHANTSGATNGTVAEQMRIVGNKVGIGTSAPEALLHVKAADGVTGVIKIEGGNATSTAAGEINSQLDFGSNDASVNNTGNVGARIAAVTANTNGAVIDMAFSTFYQNASPDLAEKMRITSAGNVGIGTTVPNHTIDVKSSGTNNQDMLQLSSASGVRAQISTDAQDDGYMYMYDSGGAAKVAFRTDSNNSYISGGGNFGIGTSAPLTKLQVEEYGIDTTTTASAAVTPIAIDSFPVANFRSARYTVQVSNTTDSTYFLTEILMVHNGTTTQIVEYGTIYTGAAAEAAFTSDISTGNVRLIATPASADSMTFKVVRHSIAV